jgi:hypothetical protein
MKLLSLSVVLSIASCDAKHLRDQEAKKTYVAGAFNWGKYARE